MPRNVRNFWLELDVDGKKTTVATGPVRKDGGFCLTIYQRNAQEVTTAGRLVGFASTGGKLELYWEDSVGETTSLNTTKR